MLTPITRIITNLISDKKFSEILTGSVWALSARVIATGLATITTIVIARIYGAEVLGTVYLLTSFLALSSILTVLGTNTSILRLIPEHIVKYSPTSALDIYTKAQRLVIATSFVFGLFLFFASREIADLIFTKPHLHSYFLLTAFFVVFQSLAMLNTEAVRGIRLIRTFAFMQLLPSLSNLTILLIVTVLFFHPDNPVYATFASVTITALTGAWIMKRVFKKMTSPEDVSNPTSFMDILTISVPMFMTATTTFVIGQTGVIMLGAFRTEVEVGYYAIAVKLATLTTFILGAVNSMAAPKFSELYQNQKVDDLFHVAKKAAKLIFWTTIPILLCLIIFGESILSLLFGPDFTVAYWAMFFLVLGQFVNSFSGSTAIFMNMTGCHKELFYIKFAAAIANLCLNFFLIPLYGLNGASLSAMLSIILWNIAILAYIKWKYGRTICYFPLTYFLKFNHN